MTKLPLKRPATSGTRKGTGAGYGGPAKGLPPKGEKQAPFEVGNTPDVDAQRLGRMEAAARKEWYRSTVMTALKIAKDDRNPLAMLKAVEALQVRDPQVGPVVIRSVTSFVDDATKVDDAALMVIATGTDAETLH